MLALIIDHARIRVYADIFLIIVYYIIETNSCHNKQCIKSVYFWFKKRSQVFFLLSNTLFQAFNLYYELIAYNQLLLELRDIFGNPDTFNLRIRAR